MLSTARLILRPPRDLDAEALTAILQQPEVARWWTGYDVAQVQAELIRRRDDVTVLIIEERERVIGAIQWYEVADPDYRRAGIDLFLDAREHGRGYGPEAIHAVVDHLIDVRAHHRIVIDPAKENDRARRAYEKVGFRTVGVLRKYERDEHGAWRDGVLIELVRAEREPRAARVEIDVRDATEKDVLAVLEMMVEFFRGEEIDFDPQKGLNPLRKILADSTLGHVLVLDAGGERAGYAVLSYGFDLEFGGRDAFITDFFVVERYRNSGVGRAALERVLAIAREDGAGAVHLQVRAENAAALALYRSLGFETSLRMFMSRRL